MFQNVYPCNKRLTWAELIHVSISNIFEVNLQDKKLVVQTGVFPSNQKNMKVASLAPSAFDVAMAPIRGQQNQGMLKSLGICWTCGILMGKNGIELATPKMGTDM